MLLLAFALSAAVQTPPPAPFIGKGPHCPKPTGVHAWARDKKPGDITGDEVNKVWHVVRDGE